MFAICSRMKWAHLPESGGLYNQDPDLLDKFNEIFAAVEAHEQKEAKKREEESKKMSKPNSKGRGRAARVTR